MPRLQAPADPNFHAMCRYYGHEWVKSHMLSAKESPHLDVQVCKRDGCEAMRHVALR